MKSWLIDNKKIIYIIMFVLILGYWIFTLIEQKIVNDKKEILDVIKMRLEYKIVEENIIEDSAPLLNELDLDARQTIENFFGYLVAGEYQNAVTFLDPELVILNFYSSKNTKDHPKDVFNYHVEMFGNAMTKNNTLKEIHILKSDVQEDEAKFTVNFVFPDREIQKNIILRKYESPEYESGYKYYIVSKIEQLIPR